MMIRFVGTRSEVTEGMRRFLSSGCVGYRIVWLSRIRREARQDPDSPIFSWYAVVE